MRGAVGNPDGRRGKQAPSPRTDGWVNVLSGFGTSDDKRTSTKFGTECLASVEAADLWRGDDMAARIVEDIPAEMYREGIEFTCEDDDATAAVHEELERLAAVDCLVHGGEFERAYGGAAIFPVINDSTGDLALPLSESTISEIKHLQVFEAEELYPHRFYTDIRSPKFGEPEVYQYVPISAPGASTQPLTYIHESRLITFPGIRVTRRQLPGSAYGWGDSVFNRVWRVLSDFGIAWSSAAVLLHEFAVGVMSMDGLAQLLGTEDGEKMVIARLKGMMLGKSTIKSLLVDSKDKYSREQTPVTGLPDLLDKFWTRLAAAANMPVTRLSGMSPGGLNSTGESDTRAWYDTIAVHQHRAMPRVRRLVHLILLAKSGPTRGKVPPGWQVKFKPLWQPSEKEIAEARKLQAETDKIYIEAQVIDPDDVAESRFGEDGYSHETTIDWARRKKREVTQAEVAAAVADPALVRGAAVADPAMVRGAADPAAKPAKQIAKDA